MTIKDIPSGNEGIVAESVSAQVMAVGRNARASQAVSSGDLAEFRASLEELKAAIGKLALPDGARASVSGHVAELEAEAAKASPDRGRVEGALRSLAASTKLIGEFVSNAGTVLGPIAKLATLFGFAIL
ncbi:hypothetical protein [Bradyrhizobium sp. AZCC 2230]|uniref:hypothetical protein n=1 Tax=Bradyrhizobium sp. AZCC 2230 TaxID=3117021 RepID=UPI002FEFC912